MDKSKFWQIIEAAKKQSNGDVDRQVKIIEQELNKLSPEEITSFVFIFWDMMTVSFTNELWAAGYIINGGCSDDGFEYFRGWLIAQGEHIFQSALKDPDSLAEVVNAEDEYVECEEIMYVGQRVYEAKTGKEILAGGVSNYELKGNDWSEDDLDTMFPRLCAKFNC